MTANFRGFLLIITLLRMMDLALKIGNAEEVLLTTDNTIDQACT